jgi:hypothetical protein
MSENFISPSLESGLAWPMFFSVLHRDLYCRVRRIQAVEPFRSVEHFRNTGNAPNSLICTGETYKNVVKMTFAKGAALKGL